MSDEWGCVTIILCTWCGVAICQHGDITEISSQVVQSYKCFNGEVNSRKIFNAKQLEKHKKLSWWYCHMVVSFNWLQKQLQFLTLNGGRTVKWWLELPHFECPQWPLPLVAPPPHTHDPPDMQTSLLSTHPGVGRQQELTDMKSMN